MLKQAGLRRLASCIFSALGCLVPAGLALAADEGFEREGAGQLVHPVAHACLALAIYHEARGEPLEGQIAVAMTVLNRVASKAYPDTICGVVFQNMRRRNACQFTFACNGRALVPGEEKAFARSVALARIILKRAAAPEAFANDYFLNTMRKYAHVTHYHRVDVRPSWSGRLVRVAKVGDHLFLASPRVLNCMPVRLVSARSDRRWPNGDEHGQTGTQPVSGLPMPHAWLADQPAAGL